MLANNVTNKEMKQKVFYRRGREESNLENQLKTDYQFRKCLIQHEFIELNEGDVSVVEFHGRKCSLRLINLNELVRVDTLYVYDASRLARSIVDNNELQYLHNKYNVRLVSTGSSAEDMSNSLFGFWEGIKIGKKV
ncbi:recombinase family protein [Metabacillus litoralis]|uniref:recombinase family protein n=1 Tax=Metabacillus litoralis TaxID=152268 RepID=UPI001CFDF32A|nr:recombinase family protein [Metabacillus litoralis]